MRAIESGQTGGKSSAFPLVFTGGRLGARLSGGAGGGGKIQDDAQEILTASPGVTGAVGLQSHLKKSDQCQCGSR